MKSFAELGVREALADVLAQQGIIEPFPIQSLAVPIGLSGHDIIGQARTGTGKTLAFGIPLLQRNHTLTPPCHQWPSSHHAHISGDRAMLIAFLYETIGRYFRYRSQLASINDLDDRTLRDIGLNRDELKTTAWHLVY